MRNTNSRRYTPSQQTTRPAPQYQQPGFMSMMVTGLALGAGSEVGHQAVRSVSNALSGNSQPAGPQQTVVKDDKCQQYNQQFVTCLNSNYSSISSCQQYMDALRQCEQYR